jgi:hypothetical protein
MAQRQSQPRLGEPAISRIQTRAKTRLEEQTRFSGAIATDVDVDADASRPKRRKSAYAAESARMAGSRAGTMPPDEDAPLLGGSDGDNAHSNEGNVTPVSPMPAGPESWWTRRTQWIFFALASGACAAFNGVFAKL